MCCTLAVGVVNIIVSPKELRKWLVLLTVHLKAVFIEKWEEIFFETSTDEPFNQALKCIKWKRLHHMNPLVPEHIWHWQTAIAVYQFEFFCLPEVLCLILGHHTSRIWNLRHPFDAPSPHWPGLRRQFVKSYHFCKVLALWHADGPHFTWECTALHETS